MAYSELVKNFNKIRDYMREFYVYGFKSRGEYGMTASDIVDAIPSAISEVMS